MPTWTVECSCAAYVASTQIVEAETSAPTGLNALDFAGTKYSIYAHLVLTMCADDQVEVFPDHPITRNPDFANEPSYFDPADFELDLHSARTLCLATSGERQDEPDKRRAHQRRSEKVSIPSHDHFLFGLKEHVAEVAGLVNTNPDCPLELDRQDIPALAPSTAHTLLPQLLAQHAARQGASC